MTMCEFGASVFFFLVSTRSHVLIYNLIALMSRLGSIIAICIILFSPEALGIAPGAIFLICLMLCLVGFATNHPHKVRRTSLSSLAPILQPTHGT
jgi:hypothetical protein